MSREARIMHARQLMAAAFGIGVKDAHQILRENVGAKRIYDCALAVIAEEYPSPIDRLRAELAKPVTVEGEERQWLRGTGEIFDPWNIFPSLYGSYSSEFDNMAIRVLENIVHGRGRWGADHGEGLAHEMFREMLCVAGLCNYGTSPRSCFPDYVDGESTEPLLVELLAKWRQYRDAEWAE